MLATLLPALAASLEGQTAGTPGCSPETSVWAMVRLLLEKPDLLKEMPKISGLNSACPTQYLFRQSLLFLGQYMLPLRKFYLLFFSGLDLVLFCYIFYQPLEKHFSVECSWPAYAFLMAMTGVDACTQWGWRLQLFSSQGGLAQTSTHYFS